jgi:oxygen-independent coproporphyrinogen-3 oxidase
MVPIGVYVHFPYCLAKCPYCDFVSYAAPRETIPHEAYADAVIAELDARREHLAARRLETVFFGGGTPSLWNPTSIARVLRAIVGAADEVGDLEVTVECNPTSLDEERARALIDAGVNRVSIGVQGLDAGRLKFLGRLHDPDGALRAVEGALRAGVPRVSADLIFGVGGRVVGDVAEPALDPEASEQAAEEARRVAATGVTHVSAYGLTIEPGTQFGERARRGRLPLATDDVIADSFHAIERALGDAGLDHYEVSNYARPGHEARHNLGYWRGHEYLGIGCGAYGTVVDRRRPGHATRYRNVIDPKRYLAIATGPREAWSASTEDEELDPETRLRERIMLGLRIRGGFDFEGSARELGVEAWPERRLASAIKLEARGQLARDGGMLAIPRDAWNFADGIAAALF